MKLDLNSQELNDKCIAYLTGELDSAAREAFETDLAGSAELKQLVERYREVLGLEEVISHETPDSSPSFAANFAVRVMEALDEERSGRAGFFERYFSMTRRMMFPLAATCAAITAVIITTTIKTQKDLSPASVLESASKTAEEQGDRFAKELPKAPAVAPKQEWQIEEKKADANKVVQDSSASLQQRAAKPQDLVAAEKAGAAVSSHSREGSIKTGSELISSDGSEAEDEAYFRLKDLKIRKRVKSTGTSHDLMNTVPGSAAGARVVEDADMLDTLESYEDGEGARLGGGEIGNLNEKPATKSESAAPQVEQERAVVAGAGVWSEPAYYQISQDSTEQPRYELKAGKWQRVIYPPAPADYEEYGIYEENPRVQVSKEPRSTFSFDVDTGSYSNMRRFLSMGQLPPQNSVRIEELVNYFNYNYPTQTDKPFAVHYEIAPAPLASGRHLLKIGVKAKDAVSGERKPWNLVFLIDVSGSMESSNKLPLLKRAFEVLISNMRNEDRIALVTYANGAQVALTSTPGSERERISAAINGLVAAGSTNGSAGIDMAYTEAEKFKQSGAVNRVILATDGDFNVGTTSFEGLMQMIEAKRRSGITLTALGFGEANLKEKTLEQLADRGNGNYFYLDSFAEARKVLGTQLASNLEIVAKDVKLQIEFNPRQVIEYRLVGYDNRKLANEDFANDAVDAGEIGAGHTVTALYEVVLAGSNVATDVDGSLRYQAEKTTIAPPTESTFSSELAFVKVRFKAPQSDVSDKMQFPIEGSSVKSDINQASDDFRFAASVAGFGQLLRGSKYASGYNFKDVSKLANGAQGGDAEGQRRQFIELVENAAAKGSTSTYQGRTEVAE